QPCSMQFERYRLEERDRMVAEFTRRNRCDQCYVSIRSYVDKTFPQLAREYIGSFFSFKRRWEGVRRNGRAAAGEKVRAASAAAGAAAAASGPARRSESGRQP
ncbi:MAG: hypothetical protein NZ554_05365, partial [Bryobacteraceae bacterium]|nr:hypothetical protein [Bryobacteraceae bacterium]